MTVTVPPPSLLKESGALLWSPPGTALPANTVIGGICTDVWPAGWVPLGKTAAGSKFSDAATSSDYESAEDYYPMDSATTKRVATVTFSLLGFTATNLSRALNGAVTTVTGSGTTLLTQVDAPNPVNEVPAQIGWESLDATVRWVGRQVRNTGNLDVQVAKAPNMGQIMWTGNCVKPQSSPPYSWFMAGSARA